MPGLACPSSRWRGLAAASGCEAALDAEWYLRDTPEVPTPEGMPEGDLAEAQWAAPVVEPAAETA